jgi:hypothetical protein
VFSAADAGTDHHAATQSGVVANDGLGRLQLGLARRGLGRWVGVRNLTLEPAPPQRTHAPLLALVVILAVIPPGLTAANQTALNGMPS